MSQRRLNDIRGVENHERLDEELYQDFETEADRKVRCTEDRDNVVAEQQVGRVSTW